MDAVQFQKEFIANYEKAKLLYDVKADGLLKTVSSRGGVETAKDLIRRRLVSEGFEALAGSGHAELTLEALVVKNEYAELFTDEEVNACFALLCEYGYFG